jgi:hypothetical protein
MFSFYNLQESGPAVGVVRGIGVLRRGLNILLTAGFGAWG